MILNSRRHYAFKGLKWYVYNGIVGTSPLLFIYGISRLIENHWGEEYVHEMIYKECILLFVSATLMGAVAVDFWQANYHLNKYVAASIYISPFACLLILYIQYFLIKAKVNTLPIFDPFSFGTIFRVVFASIYCVAGKAMLFIHEEIKQKLTVIPPDQL